MNNFIQFQIIYQYLSMKSQYLVHVDKWTIES